MHKILHILESFERLRQKRQAKVIHNSVDGESDGNKVIHELIHIVHILGCE